jgi:hypothetical protein
MLLGFLILASLGMVVWLWRRDRRYARKDLKEVAGEDLKAYLNLPHEKARFSGELEARAQKTRPSRDLLREMNRRF